MVYLHIFHGGVGTAWINTTGELSESNTKKRRSVFSSKHRLCYHSLSTRHFPFQEASSINKSLSALGNVIMALVDITHGKTRHVHYRDSKLTFLLRVSSFCYLCKTPLPLTKRGSVCYSSHPGSLIGFQAFPRRTEENLQGKPDQLGVCQFVVQKKRELEGKNHFALFHSLPTNGFFPRIWQRARKTRKERLWKSLGKKRFIKCPSQCQHLVMITFAFAIPITLDQWCP